MGKEKNKTLPSSMESSPFELFQKEKGKEKGGIKPMPDDMHGMYVFGGVLMCGPWGHTTKRE